MIRYNAKSPGGLCKDYVDLYPYSVAKEALIAGGQWIFPINEDADPERFYFIKDTALVIEKEISVDGALMYEVTMSMSIAGDDQSRISAINKHRRKKYILRYTDRTHTDKIMGHPSGGYASLLIDERNGGLIRSDRKEFKMTWRCILPEPMAVYRL